MSRVFHGQVIVRENVSLARDTYRIRLEAPDLARTIRPGQFVMIRAPHTTDPLLGRPFALYDTVHDGSGNSVAIDIVYLVVGKVTSILAAARESSCLEIWGPLGNGFPHLDGLDHIGLVAGGIGQTPFLAYARQLLGQKGYAGEPARREVARVSIYYGVRTRDLAAGIEDFHSTGASVQLSTNDGSLGYGGFITDLVAQHEPPDHLVGCGPQPMLKALAVLAKHRGIPCHVSLESPMACGIGICFSCVAKVRTVDGWDYRRICLDGPVFDVANLQDW
jgi:dihydroorotate dehydrogenase electron transfer subunit